MASPVVQQAIESSTNTAGTSHVVTLPTATAGDLLLIILDKGSTAATINAFTGLTELLDENSANGLYIAYRWMDGTEPASYTLVSSASTRTARIAYRISGAEDPATQAPQIATTATGTSATPDPPSITPPSSKDYLFIAFAGMAGEEADDDTWGNTPPTNYTPNPPRQKACGTVGTNLGGLIVAAERQLTTGSAENPGTFGVDVSAAWRAQTIMIHPANAVSVALTTVLGTGAVGSMTASAALALTSVLGTGAVQAPTPSLSPALSGASAAGSVGSMGVSVTYGADVALTGVSSAGAVGTMGGTLEKALTGAPASGAVGSLGKTADRALSGVPGAGAVGSLARGETSLGLGGVQAAGFAGDLVPSAAVLVALVGNAVTAAVGSLSVAFQRALSTVLGTGAAGTVVPSVATVVQLTGNSATGQVGSMARGETQFGLTGFTAPGAVGTITVSYATEVALSGVASTVSVGSLTKSFAVGLPGVPGAGAVGAMGPVIQRAASGVQAAPSVGSMTPALATQVQLLGNAAVGQVGSMGLLLSVPMSGTIAGAYAGTLVAMGFFIPSLERTLTVAGENRRWVVEGQGRWRYVGAESRMWAANAEGRLISISAESRIKMVDAENRKKEMS